MSSLRFIIFPIIMLCNFSCVEKNLKQVTVAEFELFAEATLFRTDAEKYGWSIVQHTIHDFEVWYDADWRCPDGVNDARPEEPVRQVSYNDALAYATWAGTRIPSYEEYWTLAKSDSRPIHQSASGILPLDQVNLIGNVWELTTPDASNQIRLAGGSYLCNPNSCNGTSPSRELFVDVETGNCHIGFAVVE